MDFLTNPRNHFQHLTNQYIDYIDWISHTQNRAQTKSPVGNF